MSGVDGGEGRAGASAEGDPGERPNVVAGLAATADGRTAIGGRARDLVPAWHGELMRSLRARSDAVLVGTRTIARDGEQLDVDDRLTVVATRTLQLRLDVPIFRDPSSRVLVLSAAPVVMPAVPASVEVERVAEAELDVPALLRRLRARHGVRTLACAGGPTVVGALASAGALDELHLTVTPRLAGAGGPPILAAALEAPVDLTLSELSERDGAVRLSYRARDPA